MNHLQPAFIIKNYIPHSYKVLLLHPEHGKIFCMYGPADQAILLTTGSFILCTLQKKSTMYSFLDLQIEYNISIHHISFIHDIIKLCMKNLPYETVVPELFDFLLYIYKHLDMLSDEGKSVALLRFFLMLDLLDDDMSVHHVAALDPVGPILQDRILLDKYVGQCWDRFFQNM